MKAWTMSGNENKEQRIMQRRIEMKEMRATPRL